MKTQDSKGYFDLLSSEDEQPTNLPLVFLLLRFNRLSVDAVDESSFAHLTNLQVLDISTGNTDLPFKTEEMEEEQDT